MTKKEIRYGKGLNSIAVRLTLVYSALAAICLLVATVPFLSEHSASDLDLHLSYAFGGLAATAALMVMMGRQLTRPIRKLTAVACRIADGDLEVEVPVSCHCEIGGLGASMRTMVRRLRESTAEIRKLASHDAVTRLPNRQHFQTSLARHVRSLGPDGKPAEGSVFFIDIADLRKVNDRFGHETSDQLLKKIAGLLLEALPDIRSDDGSGAVGGDQEVRKPTLARFGGTELVVSMPGVADQSSIQRIACRLLAALADTIEVAGRQFRPKVGIGTARYPVDSGSADKLIQYAALACNSALASMERDTTAQFDATMLHAVEVREAVERDLRTAIAERRFEVYYQPKVSTGDWAVTGVEALVRMNHPERGVVGPNEFIPVAEMAGLIGDIGFIVFEEAIRQCAAWSREGQPTEVSVNVSVEQFQNVEFSDRLIAVLALHQCPAHLITIEITETVATTNIAGVAGHIAALRDAGVHIAIDDFGTGYSNLVQLTGLKFDILKVDRSFVSGIDQDGAAREVSRAIIQLGKTLGCRVVVEGTETPAQVAAAAQLGCDEIQGFYFSRPMKCSEFEAWRNVRNQNQLQGPLNAVIKGGLAKASA